MPEFAWCKSTWFVVIVVVAVWGWSVMVVWIMFNVSMITTVHVTISPTRINRVTAKKIATTGLISSTTM